MSGNPVAGAGRPTAMRTATAALVLILVPSACGRAHEATSGITGIVRAGPTCPVETIDLPCPLLEWEGTVRATASDGATFETDTDGDGAYALAVPPGVYDVTALTEAGGPPTAVPVRVTVAEGETLTVDLEVDTGIR